MDYLASMYIDNEIDLDEKVLFVDKIHLDHSFYQDTRALLLQEKLLRRPPDTSVLPAQLPLGAGVRLRLKQWLKPLIYATVGFSAAGLILISLLTPPVRSQCANRFVIYDPSARQVELAGSFTGWQRVPLHRAGDSGYWELTLPVAPGEHRFAYILDGERQMADPTLPALEQDDFGGENSILNVGLQI